MCSLYFLVFYSLNPYHTSGKNIQILGKLNFKNFSELCYNEHMTEDTYTGNNCCAECTCTNSHKSKPVEE
jgi:hypothetical protein